MAFTATLPKLKSEQRKKYLEFFLKKLQAALAYKDYHFQKA